MIDWSPWTLTAQGYAKCYVWAGDAGNANGHGSHTCTDTANTGGFGTLNTPREAMGYAVQHGGDSTQQCAAQSQRRETAKRTYTVHDNLQLPSILPARYPRASGARGRLTVPVHRMTLRWCSSTLTMGLGTLRTGRWRASRPRARSVCTINPPTNPAWRARAPMRAPHRNGRSK